MKIKEIIDRLNDENENIKTAQLCKEIGIGEKRLRDGLKLAGFVYDNSYKLWRGGEESTQSLDKSIFEFVPLKSSVSKKSTSQTRNKNVKTTQQVTPQKDNVITQMSNTDNEIKFTQEQFLALQEIANQYITEKASETQRDRLHKRIIKLPSGDMVRKTVVIHKDVGDRLDKFADMVRFNKSDILSLALMDFLDRYENEED